MGAVVRHAVMQHQAEARQVPAAQEPQVPAEAIGMIRAAALRDRLAVRLDLAGPLFAPGSAQMRLERLVRLLRQGLARPPVFYRPGDPGLSFDEAWLLRMLERAARGDEDALAFALRRRLPKVMWFDLRFLLRAVARDLDVI